MAVAEEEEEEEKRAKGRKVSEGFSLSCWVIPRADYHICSGGS